MGYHKQIVIKSIIIAVVAIISFSIAGTMLMIDYDVAFRYMPPLIMLCGAIKLILGISIIIDAKRLFSARNKDDDKLEDESNL